jgi:hypothetical protein
MENINHLNNLNSDFASLSSKTEIKKTSNTELHSTVMAITVVLFFFIVSLFVC